MNKYVERVIKHCMQEAGVDRLAVLISLHNRSYAYEAAEEAKRILDQRYGPVPAQFLPRALKTNGGGSV